jgi:hypothetical protein
MKIVEPKTPKPQPVNVGGVDLRSINTEIRKSHVIENDVNNVGAPGFGL